MRRENLYRACMPGVELREADGDTGMPTMTGHFAVFNTDTEINSSREGRFIERLAPGAFTKTLKERRDQVKVMFNHGRDPQIGEKPLGPIAELREDETGAYYEVPLLDAGYVRELLPALKAGLLGASFRFSVVREDIVDKPARSAANPDRIPERTIREAKLFEFGPVVNPAYAAATAGIRSITDEIMDVDAIALASPILLDEERTMRARVFLSRTIPEVEDAAEERKDYSADQRKQLASEGKALPDGSFPIVTVADLENAIHAFGRASDKAAAKAHIMKRARALGRSDLIPQDWMSSNSSDESTTAPTATAEPPQAHPSRTGRGSTYPGLYGPESTRKPSWLL